MINLRFFTKYDGAPAFSDIEIMYLLDRSEGEGTLTAFLGNNTKFTKEDFFIRVKNDHRSLFFSVYKEGVVVGFGLLDHLEFDHAHCHFCYFQEFWGEQAIVIAKEVYKELLTKFSVLVGITPEDNIYAVSFCDKINMKKVGVIPKYFYNNIKEKHIDGIIHSITREV